MNQIYIPKNRLGMASGSFVIVKPIEQQEVASNPILYGFSHLEPIKMEIIHRIFHIADRTLEEIKNIIITGSFLEEGFYFNDIDIVVISEKSITQELAGNITSEIGIKSHIINLTSKELAKGIESDPLYLNIISKCVAKNRIVFNIQRKINFQLLDFHLLKSKAVINNFDYLSGREVYYLTKNMLAILLFMEGKKVSSELIDKEIKILFHLSANNIKDKILKKQEFISEYKKVYDKIFKRILEKNAAK